MLVLSLEDPPVITMLDVDGWNSEHIYIYIYIFRGNLKWVKNMLITEFQKLAFIRQYELVQGPNITRMPSVSKLMNTDASSIIRMCATKDWKSFFRILPCV